MKYVNLTLIIHLPWKSTAVHVGACTTQNGSYGMWYFSGEDINIFSDQKMHTMIFPRLEIVWPVFFLFRRHSMARVCWTSRHRSRFAMLVRSIRQKVRLVTWMSEIMMDTEKNPRGGCFFVDFPMISLLFFQSFRLSKLQVWGFHPVFHQRSCQDQKPGCNLYVTGVPDRFGWVIAG